MYYQLLTIKARDKAYITHTSDSLILEVLHYYEKRKDKKHLPEAYYYAGRIYRDLGDAPQALEYFFKAIDVSSACMNYRLTSRINRQIEPFIFIKKYMIKHTMYSSKHINMISWQRIASVLLTAYEISAGRLAH